MKVRTQLTVVFLLVMSGMLGGTVFSLFQIDKVFTAANFATVNSMPSVTALDHALDEVATLRIRTWQFLVLTDKTKAEEIERDIATSKEKINEQLKLYEEKLIANDQDRRLLNADHALLQEYDAIRTKVFDLVKADKREMAVNLMLENQTLLSKLRKGFREHRDYNFELANKSSQDALEVKQSAFWFSVIASTLLIIMVGALVWAIARNVLSQLGCEPKEAADMAHKISVGDLSFAINTSGQSDSSLLVALKTLVTNFKSVVDDAHMLSKAAVEGNLATRADAAKHQGDYRKIVEGVNQTLDAVIGPLNVAANYVDNISKGVIPPQITDTYNGDFNVIKNNLNVTVQMMNDLLAETDKVIAAAADGKLDTRADTSKFVGGWKQLVSGVNDTITNIVDPLNVTADYVDKVSKGIIPPAINTEYKGQYNLIKLNLNALVRMMSDLLAETDAITKAAVAGQLKTRADANKFVGGWNSLVTGVNQTLDAVIGPLNVAAEYVDRIAKGDIPPKIIDSYNGDFNAIKNNLNLAIDNVNALVSDALMLSKAAVEGKLATRADASQHHGDYRKIVQGVNDTLDAMVDPIEQVQRVLAALAKGDLTEKIHQNYQGAFAKLRDDANTTVDTLASSVTTIKDASDAINSASKEIASGNSDLSQRTEEQASSLEETASSMEELASTVKQNADNAKQANQMSAAASEVAMKGGKVVQQVVGTMSDINESSRKIVDIISVIDGIAFQTNILALNAAVEAARAGEQGRGFAVVASEVRNLAQRSAAAAKEIKALIGDSVDKVENGSKLVAEAGRTMDEIVASVKRVTDIMGEIASASLEQSSGIEQVNQAITQMDDVTQQNAALVEQAAAAAESLEDQAEQLTSLMSRFRLSSVGSMTTTSKIRQFPTVQKANPVKLVGKGKLAGKVDNSAAAPKLLASNELENWSEF